MLFPRLTAKAFFNLAKSLLQTVPLFFRYGDQILSKVVKMAASSFRLGV
jgi:hypothetical protein